MAGERGEVFGMNEDTFFIQITELFTIIEVFMQYIYLTFYIMTVPLGYV